MLTFHFTGVDGSMTESETLTSGMVGKEVRLILDESWNNLTKTAVFRAGEVTRVVLNPGDTVVIPSEVLEQPFGKLSVGIYGTNDQGDLVIPTIMAEGPIIRYGADPIVDETAKALPVWKHLYNQIVTLSAEVAELTQRMDALSTPPTEDLSHLTHYWDFRTGSLTDRIAGLEATASADVTLDAEGAHISTDSSYIMLPAGADGATLAGQTVEIKFGQMTLDETASILRLFLVCTGNQPASAGLQWTVRKCWSSKSSLVTEFTDLNMFSGKTVVMKANEDATLLQWYMDDQLIVSYEPTLTYSHVSIGTSSTGAFPLTVEYLKIYPNT